MENLFMEPLEVEQERAPFEIIDDRMAEWAMNKIAEARSDTLKWETHFSAQMDKIRKSNEADESFFTAALARYFDAVPPHKVTKTQSKYVLPCGELVRQRQGPEFLRDESVLVPFLLDNDLAAFVKNKPSADWGALKKRCVLMDDGSVADGETGLVLEGVTAELRPDKFEVKINGC